METCGIHMSEEGYGSESLLAEYGDAGLLEFFPEAKLTMRDRLPINFILTNALITIQKSILNIKYSSEEIREAIQGFVAMIPDTLKDKEFNEEIEQARIRLVVNSRPTFCGIPASDAYCKRKGITTETYVESFDFFKVLHACFNLLMRRDMLLKKQPKEIFTGKRAKKNVPKYEPEPTDQDNEF
jgi:hypothetical protein